MSHCKIYSTWHIGTSKHLVIVADKLCHPRSHSMVPLVVQQGNR
jgi:hypothetical protein